MNYYYQYDWLGIGKAIGVLLSPLIFLFILWIAAPILLAYLVLAYFFG